MYIHFGDDILRSLSRNIREEQGSMHQICMVVGKGPKANFHGVEESPRKHEPNDMIAEASKDDVDARWGNVRK